MIVRPQPPPLATGSRLGGDQIIVGGETPEGPGPALRHEFPVEIPLVDPEPAQQPAMLIAGRAGHANAPTGEFLGQGPAGRTAVGLALLRGVDADQPDLLAASRLVAAGHRVAVVNRLDLPEGPAGLVDPRAHRDRQADHRREQRGDEQCEPLRAAPTASAGKRQTNRRCHAQHSTRILPSLP